MRMALMGQDNIVSQINNSPFGPSLKYITRENSQSIALFFRKKKGPATGYMYVR